MGSAPTNMNNPHRHHIGRENAPKSWSKQNRDFTWATNGRGAHTIKAAKHVWEKVMDAAPKGINAVEAALDKLGKEMSRDIFF